MPKEAVSGAVTGITDTVIVGHQSVRMTHSIHQQITELGRGSEAADLYKKHLEANFGYTGKGFQKHQLKLALKKMDKKLFSWERYSIVLTHRKRQDEPNESCSTRTDVSRRNS